MRRSTWGAASCYSPPYAPGLAAYPSATVVAVRLTKNGQNYMDSSLTFTYYAQPSVKMYDPPGGKFEGNTSTRLDGSFFGGSHYVCRYGGVQVPATYAEGGPNTTESLTCISPNSSSRAASRAVLAPPRTVSVYAQQFVLAGQFIYYEGRPPRGSRRTRGPPTAARSSRSRRRPRRARRQQAGGGEGLDGAHQYYCRFGRNPKVEGTYVGNSVLNCTSPPLGLGEPARSPVSVTLNDQDYTPLGGGDGRDYDFLYYVEPNIRAIFPVSGPTDGGSIVSVWGTGPWGNTHTDGDISEMHDYRCRIGTGPHALTFPAVLDTVDDHALRCVTLEFNATDAERNGPFSDLRRFPLPFSVSLNAQQFTTESAANWTYQRPPKKPLSLPSTGPLHGNTTITVYGSGDELMGGSWSQCKLNLRDGPAVDEDGLPPAVGTWGGTYFAERHVRRPRPRARLLHRGDARRRVRGGGDAQRPAVSNARTTAARAASACSSSLRCARRSALGPDRRRGVAPPQRHRPRPRLRLRLPLRHWAFHDGDDEAGSGDEGDFGSGDSGSGEAEWAWSSADNATGADWGHVAAAPWADAAASARSGGRSAARRRWGARARRASAPGVACTAATMVSDTEVVCRSPRVAPARGARAPHAQRPAVHRPEGGAVVLQPADARFGGAAVGRRRRRHLRPRLRHRLHAVAAAHRRDGDGGGGRRRRRPRRRPPRRAGAHHAALPLRPGEGAGDRALRHRAPLLHAARRARGRAQRRPPRRGVERDGGGGAVVAVDARGRRAVGRRRRRRSNVLRLTHSPFTACDPVCAELRDGARARDGAPLERRVRRASAAQLGV